MVNSKLDAIRSSILAGVAALTLATGALTLGCGGGYGGHPVQAPPADQFAAAAHEAGLVVGAESYAEPAKAEHTFGARVATKYVPVLVSVKNTTGEHALVARNRAILTTAGGQQRAVHWEQMFEDFKGSEGMDVALWGVASGGVAKANKAMAADWRDKALPDETTLSPGGTVSGFVFFEKPEGKPPFVLNLAIDLLKSSETIEIDLPLARGASVPAVAGPAVPTRRAANPATSATPSAGQPSATSPPEAAPVKSSPPVARKESLLGNVGESCRRAKDCQPQLACYDRVCRPRR